MRFCGIRETCADVIAFVDDDNVLDHHYLETAIAISEQWPMIGAWGGQLQPEFEARPPEWTKPYWGLMAQKTVSRPAWANVVGAEGVTPCGAGMCIRRRIAEAYAEVTAKSDLRIQLGRRGNSLCSAEDIDMAETSYDLGFGTGLFPELFVTHLIPSSRMEERYLLRLTEAIAYSDRILAYIRGRRPRETPIVRRFLRQCKLILVNPRAGRFCRAHQHGLARACARIAECESDILASAEVTVRCKRRHEHVCLPALWGGHLHWGTSVSDSIPQAIPAGAGVARNLTACLPDMLQT